MLVLHINTYSVLVVCWYYTLILIVRGWCVGITLILIMRVVITLILIGYEGGCCYYTLILIVRWWSVVITH